MCGILAVIGKYRYKEIPESLKNRGVDSNGIYEDDNVQLFQTRLQITGSDYIDIPIETDRYILLFNGEIYNYKELNKELNDFNFKYDSDFETALYSYIKWGISFTDKLNGQYAIFIWDKLEKKQSVFFDDLRIKTLYKREYDNSIIYSSNIKSFPEIKFKKINNTGYGNISDAILL